MCCWGCAGPQMHDPRIGTRLQIREAQLAQFNYILVVGDKEQQAETVNVRTRDNHVHGEHALVDVIDTMRRQRDTRSLESLFGDEPQSAPAAVAASALEPAAP
jgi:threonyl-tRNA synthetase